MLKNMQINTRMILSYVVLIVFMAIVGVVSIVSLNSVGNALQDFHDTAFQTVQNAWRGRWAAASLRSNLLQGTLEDDATRNASYVQQARQQFSDLQSAVTELEKTYTGDVNGDRSKLNDLKTNISAATPMLEQLYVYAANNDVERGYSYMINTYEPVANQIRDILGQISDDADARAQVVVNEGNSTAHTAEVIQVILIVVGAAFGVFLGITMANGIVTPVNEMQEVTLAVSQGDFESVIKYESKDALGSLANNMRHLTATIKEIITDVEMQLAEMGRGNFNIRSRKEEMYLGSFSRLQTAMTTLTQAVSDTMANGIVTPVNEMQEVTLAVSQGDFESVIKYESKDALGALANNMRHLTATIKEIITDVEMQLAEMGRGNFNILRAYGRLDESHESD